MQKYLTRLNLFNLLHYSAKIEEHPDKPLWLDRGHIHFYAREFKNGEHINYYIEFLPRNGLCEQKKVFVFSSFCPDGRNIETLKQRS